MKDERAEGIVLRAVPFQDCHHITTVFTEQRGLISLFVRGTHRSRHFSHAVVTPLTRAEFHYGVKENKDLFRFKDASVLDQHLNLRGDYHTLEMACEMAQALLATQVQWKPAPRLYCLFLSYLSQAARTDNPNALFSSFLLKVLKHEGLLALHDKCTHCEAPLTSVFLWGSEGYCAAHAPEGAISLSDEERAQLVLLSAARTLREVEALEIPSELKDKSKLIFTTLTS